MFPQLERLGEVIAAPPQLAKISVGAAYSVIARGKVRIEFDGTLKVRQSCSTALLASSLFAEAVRLQGFERGSCGLSERNVKLLYGCQRLAQFASQLRLPPRPVRPAPFLLMPPSLVPALACLRSDNSLPSHPERIRCPERRSTRQHTPCFLLVGKARAQSQA